MVLAVLERRAGVKIGKSDVFAATVGGVRLTEPSADLAIALAMASSVSNLAIPQGVIAFGEVGLAAEVRPVAGVPRRVSEAERMGFRRAIVPASGAAGDKQSAPGKAAPPGKAGPEAASRQGSTGRTLKVAGTSGGIEVVEVED